MPGGLLDETGEIVWSGLNGLTLSDAINALYMVEVERQLVRFFDVLLKKDLPAHDLEMIGAVITGRATGNGLELIHGADAIEAVAKDRDAANKWLAAVSWNPVGLSRARAQARVALGSGFWQTLDGTGFRAVAEPTDPLDRYGVHLPAWDVASRAWLGRFERTIRDSRMTWISAAASHLFATMDAHQRLRIIGVDAAKYEQNDQLPELISRRVFLASPRYWRLHRLGSILELLRSDGGLLRAFREVRFLTGDSPRTALLNGPEERAACPEPVVRPRVRTKPKKGNSYRKSDQPWIEAMHAHALAGTSKNTLDAALAVVGIEIDGQKVKGAGNNDSKVSRLRGLYTIVYGAWPSAE